MYLNLCFTFRSE